MRLRAPRLRTLRNRLQRPPRPEPPVAAAFVYFISALLLLWLWQEALAQTTVRTLPYSAFKEHVARGEVVEATVKPDEIVGRIRTRTADGADSGSGDAGGTFLFRTVRLEDPDLVRELRESGTTFSAARPGVLTELLVSWVLPIAVMAMVWILLLRRLGGAGPTMLSAGGRTFHVPLDRDTGVRFSDVAGCEEAKQELVEIVEFLRQPERFRKLGARIPKGVLLVGPPGTGKTLLARAVAGEAGVTFFSLSGSDFVELFVGMGAARVRELFQHAKRHAPCIVFIDELDAIGRQRGVHVGAVNDEREQTLNALLVEMDGFAANTGVIVLAATNRPEILDRALLRPGRFDRQVVVDAPDRAGREAILRVHARDKKLSSEVDLGRIAAATVGLAGADLANILNEAALLAARRSAGSIQQRDLEEAIEKVLAGPARRSRRLKDEEKQRVAYHEAGHALVAAHGEHTDPVHRISIVPRGRGALGYTLQLPEDEQMLATRAELLARIRVLLGGRAAEELVFGDVSTGAENDLERATTVARQMVTRYGMSEEIGLARCLHHPASYLAEGPGAWQRDCSEQTAAVIDAEVKRILTRCYSEARSLLAAHQDQLRHVTAALLEHETLDGPEFYRLLEKSSRPDATESPPAPLGRDCASGSSAAREIAATS